MDVAWNGRVNSNQYVGPRLFAAGNFLTTRVWPLPDLRTRSRVRWTLRVRQAIREQIKNGVDHIKLNLSGGILGPAGIVTESFLLPDEIKGRFRGLPLSNSRSWRTRQILRREHAIRLGAHSVEHALHHGRRMHRALSEARHMVRPHALDSHLTPKQATNKGSNSGQSIATTRTPSAAAQRRHPSASLLVREGPEGRSNGSRLRHSAAQGCRNCSSLDCGFGLARPTAGSCRSNPQWRRGLWGGT